MNSPTIIVAGRDRACRARVVEFLRRRDIPTCIPADSGELPLLLHTLRADLLVGCDLPVVRLQQLPYLPFQLPVILLGTDPRAADMTPDPAYRIYARASLPQTVDGVAERLLPALRAAAGEAAFRGWFCYDDGWLQVDRARRSVWAGGQAVTLTDTEFLFLLVLLRHPGEVVSHEALLRAVWGWAKDPPVSGSHVYASRLRRKLGSPPGAAAYLQTVFGVGYRVQAGGAGCDRAG